MNYFTAVGGLIPANPLGMSLIAFIPFSLLVMKEPIKKDYILAALCLFGAVYFIFRNFR